MFKKNIIILAENGLHMRPAAKLVQIAQKYNSDIQIISKGKSVNAKSLFQLQTLELIKNTLITITADGKDEEKAVKNLIKIIQTLE